MAAAVLCGLPADVMRDVLGRLAQDDKTACMLVSKDLLAAATDPVLWTELIVRDPCPAAVRFFKRALHCTTLKIEGATPDDATWFLDQLADAGVHGRVRHLDVGFGDVSRVPEALLYAVCRFPSLETVRVHVASCEQRCMLRLPDYFPGLRHLRTLSVVEGAAPDVGDPWSVERNLTFRFGKSRALLCSLHTLTVAAARSDVLHALNCMPSLRRLTHLVDSETYEEFAVGQGQTLDYLELSAGEEVVDDCMGDGLTRFAHIGRLVLHARQELYVQTELATPHLTVVVDNSEQRAMPNVWLDFGALTASESIARLCVEATDSSLPGWTVRFINVPSVPAFLQLCARLNLDVEVPGQLEMTPFDE